MGFTFPMLPIANSRCSPQTRTYLVTILRQSGNTFEVYNRICECVGAQHDDSKTMRSCQQFVTGFQGGMVRIPA
jgi:hypothetical protein